MKEWYIQVPSVAFQTFVQTSDVEITSILPPRTRKKFNNCTCNRAGCNNLFYNYCFAL